MTDVADPLDEAGNAKPYTVSELAFALKRTIENAYGFVRLRGELSKVTFHGNGHIYLDLKDERAAIAGVVWRSQAQSLAVRPETGLEVIVTGRVTTYPGRSQYQIVIETMEPAGIGALLAQLERLKAKLAAEGLFAPERKRALPAMPGTIGVITSPTGAVIRDILHRISDRWPCRVIVWPVVVQGDQAAAQVKAAIEGFGALATSGTVPRPDLLIVARGGGSVEDLWPFNDEALARAVAASPIPLISAVGHETDTTLIDFVSDRRAPTPTAAAELATPVLTDLAAAIQDHGQRLARNGGRLIELRRARLAAAGRGLPRPVDLMAIASQSLDLAASRLGAALQRNVDRHRRDLVAAASALRPRVLAVAVETKSRQTGQIGSRLRPGVSRMIGALADRLAGTGKLLVSLEPRAPLKRGFALVWKADGRLAKLAVDLAGGEAIEIEFRDARAAARVDGEPPFTLSPPS
ncbi:MAG TPA: exodeoxyribonuclease VII large subunit [Caulobacteraceae bacterium]|jgi:exodeoxyribonuclease VII large subunit